MRKMTYHFPKKILGSRISLTYKRLMKILRRSLEKSYKVLKIGRKFDFHLCLELIIFLPCAADTTKSLVMC